MRLRVDLAYDGGPFHGFARQPGLTTVQGALETALERLLGQPVSTTCAGRTDRGVHARAQVVHLDLDDRIERAAGQVEDLDRFATRLDRLLGPAVTIWAARSVSTLFDARFSAVERGYRYRIRAGEAMDPLERFTTWHLPEPLAVGVMRAGAVHLVGEHDFASFCRRSAGQPTVRRVDALTVSRMRDGTIHLRVRGPAFCHQQVRSIVGVLAQVGRGRRGPAWVGEVLAARDRSAAAPLAPPHGLVLERVSYGRSWPAAPPVTAR